MPSSPLKRRKVRALLPTKVKTSTPTPAAIQWPADIVPVEIFAEIMSYLPRSTIQNMRLANKEFEKKVSTYLFQVVVVPFKPEIYGVAPDPPLGGKPPTEPPKTILLQDKGMRVFYGFGGRIKKFAMSFEFDEEKLNNPPTKSDQEAITSFWGIYPWPYQRYNRYAQLEGLEQTADETKTMAKALRYITEAHELGLSIDGGLGWLCGPDINLRVLERGLKPAVFGTPKYVPETRSVSRCGYGLANITPSSSQRDQRYQDLERMCQAAGYQGKALDAAVRLMLENEHTPPQAVEPSSDDGPSVAERIGVLRGLRPRFELAGYNTFPPQTTNTTDTDPNDLYDADDDEGDAEVEFEGEHVGIRRNLNISKPRNRFTRVETISLKPNDLTTAQKEMLLETEWAQRAFMQSYTIAIIDNATAFKGVRTLIIARLPYRHLPMLRREDFWDSLPSLSKLSLAIIPDWRDVAKHPTSWVQDIRLAPSLSVAGVYQLLKEHIADRGNIKSLHLEWLCGGEYAPGMFSRNQHVMPAPIVSKGIDMVDRTQPHSILRFPHLKHFSMKNCYVTPHIMREFALALKRDCIESITFDSVSLTASVPQYTNPNPLQNHHGIGAALAAVGHHAPAQAVQAQWQAIQGANGGPNLQLQPIPVIAPVPLVPAAITPSPDAEPEWLGPPRFDSWASIIDEVTPRQTMAQIRYDRGFSEELAIPSPNSIKKLDFTSCGYVRLPLEFDQTILLSPGLATVPTPAHLKKIHDIETHMMKSTDSLLGTIITHMEQGEIDTLQNAFALTVGWFARGNDRSDLLADCEADGMMDAGRGRFDGVITADLAH